MECAATPEFSSKVRGKPGDQLVAKSSQVGEPCKYLWLLILFTFDNGRWVGRQGEAHLGPVGYLKMNLCNVMGYVTHLLDLAILVVSKIEVSSTPLSDPIHSLASMTYWTKLVYINLQCEQHRVFLSQRTCSQDNDLVEA